MAVAVDLRADHDRRRRRVEAALAGTTGQLRLRKRTSSNLFRYQGRTAAAGGQVDLRAFDRVLHVDVAGRTLDVEGLAPYERVVDAVLPAGLLPTITPELKHITVGGAVVGIGIESNSYRYGFVHDAMTEAEVLLPDGRVVLCTPDNEHAGLFHGLANSYGTLGYVLRVTLALRPAKPFVALHTRELGGTGELLDAMAAAVDDPSVDYIECLAYAKDRLYLTVGREQDTGGPLTSIYGSTVFYREISRPGDLTLTTRDYLFRYDPEWFWGLPESRPFRLFRRWAPPGLRHSGVYGRYLAARRAVVRRLPFVAADGESLELLIQDWEVPWCHAAALLQFVFDTADLAGRPLMVAPLRVPAAATCYPMEPGALYLNVGSYNYIRRAPGRAAYDATRAIDGFCFAHDGIKMLYSTTFLGEEAFAARYGGEAYAALKQEYDPGGRLPTLFDKAVRGR